MLKYIYFLALFTGVFGQFTSLSKTGGASIYVFDILVTALVFVGILYYLLKKELFIPKYLVLFLVFSQVACLSLFISSQRFTSEELVISSLYCVRLVIYYLLGVVIASMIKAGDAKKESILNSMVISGAILGVIGLVQLIVLPDFEKLDPSLGWDPHKNRLASSFFDPNFTGGYLVIIFTILLDRLLNKGNSKTGNIGRLQKINGLLLAVLVAFIFLTFSRSAWGMLGIVILVYGLLKNRKLLVAALIVVFMAYFTVPRVQTRLSGITDPSDSASLRITSWGNAVKIIKDSSVLGVGYNGYRYIQKDYGFLTQDTINTHSGAGTDSSLLLILATTGVVGLVIFLLALLYPILDQIKKSQFIPAVVVSLLGESQFINSFFYPQIMFLLVSLLAIYSISDISQ